MGDPRLLQLPWKYLEHAGHAVRALTKSLYFRGVQLILAVHHPTQALLWSLLCTHLLYLLKDQLPGLAPRPRQLLVALGCWHALSQDVEDSED